MSRYFTRNPAPRADWSDSDYPMLPDISVPDHESTNTGLLDASGDPIWRAPNPMGFGRDGEW